jgi:hypothetical protein
MLHVDKCIFTLSLIQLVRIVTGERDGVVVEALCYKPEDRGFETR